MLSPQNDQQKNLQFTLCFTDGDLVNLLLILGPSTWKMNNNLKIN